MPFVGPIETLQIFEWNILHPHTVSEAINKTVIPLAFNVTSLSPADTVVRHAFTSNRQQNNQSQASPARQRMYDLESCSVQILHVHAPVMRQASASAHECREYGH